MGSKTPRQHATIGVVVSIVTMLWSARALAEDPTAPPFPPVPPEVVTQQFETSEDNSLTTAGITLYAAGALYDLYTTKRAIDAGLREGNPLLNGSDDPNRTLATAAVAKIGFAFLIGRLERKRSDRVRGAWYLSCGALQFGFGIYNRHATEKQREAIYTLSAPQTPTASDAPTATSTPTSTPTPTPSDEPAPVRRSRIRK
jgi:hypothetical protein